MSQTDTILEDIDRLPITILNVIMTEIDYWSNGCKIDPDRLREVSEHAIRTRYQEAVIDHEADRAQGRQPNIYTLLLSSGESASVIFTVEPHAVVIRGFCWPIDGEPLDDFDGGGFHSEYAWSLPIEA